MAYLQYFQTHDQWHGVRDSILVLCKNVKFFYLNLKINFYVFRSRMSRASNLRRMCLGMGAVGGTVAVMAVVNTISV